MSAALNALGIPKKSGFLFKNFPERAADEPQLKCKQDPDLFWSHNRNDVHRAKQQCNGTERNNYEDACQLKAMCLMYALDARERDGVWGGADEAERNLIIGRRSRAEKAAQQRARREQKRAEEEAKRAELEPALF